MQGILSNEKRPLIQKLKNNAACRPDVDTNRVVGLPEYKLWGPVAPGTNIRYVTLILLENLGRPQITNNNPVIFYKNILRFQVSMADSSRMQVEYTSKYLIHVEFEDIL